MRFGSGAARAILTAALVWAGGALAAPEVKAPEPGSLRPPADILIPCEKLPKEAVTKLPADLAAWAATYCTKFGQIFNANETHFGAFPDNGVRATFSAATIDGKQGDAGAGSFFTAFVYVDFTQADLDALLKIDPVVARITVGRKLKKLELQTNGGNAMTFLVIEPAADPFWVFPMTDKGLGSPAFFVVSLAALNRNR
ncbi:MAG: hypothetical protein U1E28_17205 [Beijerinckiaceae bacterium]